LAECGAYHPGDVVLQPQIALLIVVETKTFCRKAADFRAAYLRKNLAYAVTSLAAIRTFTSLTHTIIIAHMMKGVIRLFSFSSFAMLYNLKVCARVAGQYAPFQTKSFMLPYSPVSACH
jgi:hypothetical protein